MNIVGEKVVLRAVEPTDCELLREMINEPGTEYLLGGWSFPVSKANQERWIERLTDDNHTLRVIVDVEGQAIGTVILSDIDYKNGTAEIHIKLSAQNGRGHGYGSDSVSAIVRYAFNELRLHCIYARVNEHNHASQRMFEKCGFRQEGLLRDRYYKKGKYICEVIYSIISTECIIND